MATRTKDVITFPAEVFVNARTLNDLENWLIVHSPASLQALAEARAQGERGEVVTLAEMKRRLKSGVGYRSRIYEDLR